MDMVQLGKTGLVTSALGLGCGGYSRLGKQQGGTDEEAMAIIHSALDAGITLFDTAECYQTEEIVGKALEGKRESVVLCSKALIENDGKPRSADEFKSAIENSLRNLKTDYIDIYQIHGLSIRRYPHALEVIVPLLQKMRSEGKIRFFGATEAFESDTSHRALSVAVKEDFWDTMMVGYNMLNTSAQSSVFAHSKPKGIGILGMFAVRYAFVDNERLCGVVESLIERGELDGSGIDRRQPLGFLLDEAESLAEAAYRFVRHSGNVDVTLCGTGSIVHLRENIAAIQKPSLSSGACARLDLIFGSVNSESGKRPQ